VRLRSWARPQPGGVQTIHRNQSPMQEVTGLRNRRIVAGVVLGPMKSGRRWGKPFRSPPLASANTRLSGTATDSVGVLIDSACEGRAVRLPAPWLGATHIGYSAIRRAFRKAVLEYHPDVYDGDADEGARLLNEAREAYEFLTSHDGTVEPAPAPPRTRLSPNAPTTTLLRPGSGLMRPPPTQPGTAQRLRRALRRARRPLLQTLLAVAFVVVLPAALCLAILLQTPRVLLWGGAGLVWIWIGLRAMDRAPSRWPRRPGRTDEP